MASGSGEDAVHGLIKNAHLVTGYFGRWPSFHDAEVLRVEMSRTTQPPRMELDLYASLMSPEVDERGYFRHTHKCVVTFLLHDIQEMELEGFNQQNVISGLYAESKGDAVEVSLGPCFGLNGTVVCRSVEVLRVEPIAE